MTASKFGLLIELSFAVSLLSRVVGGWVVGGWVVGGLVGSENTVNSAQLELEVGLSLAITTLLVDT